MVGSGVYVDDIKKNVVHVEKQLGLAVALVGAFAFVLAYLVGRSVSRPILSLNETMRKLADGELDIEIKELNCSDEIGSMAQTVQVFLENARRMTVLEIEQKDTDNMKGEFVSVVSHELRTPLTSIRGSLGLIAAGAAGQLPEKAKYLVGIAYNNCERLILLINDILDIDKIAAGNMQLDIKSEKLNKLVALAIESNRAYGEKYFVRYAYQPLEPDISVNVDATRFQQILTNFLSNAAKFSLGGSHVDVQASVRNGWIRVSVKDYGLGIPDEFRGRVFKKFSQADSSSTRQKGGTGLGLYICKQLTEQMGGRVGYESKSGFGSVFWVDFPVQGSDDQGRPEEAWSLEVKQAPIQSAPANCVMEHLPILVHIEPDESFSQYLAALFHRKASVVHFSTIAKAGSYLADHAQEISCGAVVMDPNVKDIENAIEFATFVKDHDTPLIILSTREPRAELRALSQGVLTKSRATDQSIVETVLHSISESHKA